MPRRPTLTTQAIAGLSAAIAVMLVVTGVGLVDGPGPSVTNRVAGRYVPGSEAADIGGDLYEPLDTPYGVRMIIGDVKGKGIDAVRLASLVRGAYRHVAFERSDLREIVTDLDRAVSRFVGDEDF